MKNTISYTLRSNGEEFMEGFKVKSIMVLNEANRIPRAKILLLDGNVSEQDFKISNLDFFKPGRLLEIDIGFESDVTNVFKGLIIKHGIKISSTNNSYLEIECKHVAVKLIVNKKNRHFNNLNDNDVVTQLLGEAGISHKIDGMTDFTHSQLVQHESTTWDFLVSRVDVNGHLVLFDNEDLIITSPTMEGEEVADCAYGDNVISFQSEMDSESQFLQVESKAWSSAEQNLVVANESQSFKNEIGNISSEDLAQVLNNGPFHLQHAGSIPEDELTIWAKSKATKNELSKIIGNVRIRGNATVYPGKIIKLTGFGERFSGKAYVTGVRHETSEGNWTTDIQFGLPSDWFSQRQGFQALPAGGMLPAVNGLQLGVVTQLENDPDNEFRIKVRLPMVSNEEEGVWTQMAKGYAGDSYGICFLPEIGDEVVIGFLNDDPRKAVVLGMLHSSAKPAPIGPSDDNHQKAIVSRNDVKIIWNDDKKIITISTPGGNEIKLDEESQEVKIIDSHQNKIVMNGQGISIESASNLKLKARQNIDIEGINISSKANGKFAAEGNGGVEVKSNAIAILKGSLVQIN
ncbi:VgrG-related protein [soil metagenome]